MQVPSRLARVGLGQSCRACAATLSIPPDGAFPSPAPRILNVVDVCPGAEDASAAGHYYGTNCWINSCRVDQLGDAFKHGRCQCVPGARVIDKEPSRGAMQLVPDAGLLTVCCHPCYCNVSGRQKTTGGQML